jgi:hypothetical protein
MNWSYRMVRDGDNVSMREVYFDDQGQPWGHGSAEVDWESDWGGTPADALRKTLTRMWTATAHPVLVYPEDFTGSGPLSDDAVS